MLIKYLIDAKSCIDNAYCKNIMGYAKCNNGKCTCIVPNSYAQNLGPNGRCLTKGEFFFAIRTGCLAPKALSESPGVASSG